MKETKLFSSILILISICIFACEPQSNNDFLDAVELDPENYKVEFENEKVRVLKGYFLNVKFASIFTCITLKHLVEYRKKRKSKII